MKASVIKSKSTTGDGYEKPFPPMFFLFFHLILFQAAFLHHFVPLFLESDDDESHKDVDEEEGKNNKVDDVEDGHLHPVSMARASVLLCHVHRVLQNPG